jgi:hypothetical protein
MQQGSLWEDLEKTEISASRETPVSPAPQDYREEREELERVLSHPEISRSTSLVRFLTFICSKYFDGRSDEIREFSIAIDALGRKESTFDSHVDPIVRVTARLLRKKLLRLYQTDWQHHPLQIVLPLGHYVPEFVRPGASATGEPNAPVAPVPVASGPVASDPAIQSVLNIAEDGAAAAYPARARPLFSQAAIVKYAIGLFLLAGAFLAGYLAGLAHHAH